RDARDPCGVLGEFERSRVRVDPHDRGGAEEGGADRETSRAAAEVGDGGALESREAYGGVEQVGRGLGRRDDLFELRTRANERWDGLDPPDELGAAHDDLILPRRKTLPSGRAGGRRCGEPDSNRRTPYATGSLRRRSGI